MSRQELMKNMRHMYKEMLDERHGETLSQGCFNAEVSAIHDFQHQYAETNAAKKMAAARSKGKDYSNLQERPRTLNMSVFITNFRVICYKAATWILGSDRYAEIPLGEIRGIDYSECIRNGKRYAVAEIYTNPDCYYPSLRINFDTSGTADDEAAFYHLINQLARIQHVPFVDHTIVAGPHSVMIPWSITSAKEDKKAAKAQRKVQKKQAAAAAWEQQHKK